MFNLSVLVIYRLPQNVVKVEETVKKTSENNGLVCFSTKLWFQKELIVL